MISSETGTNPSRSRTSESLDLGRLRGKRVAVVVFSHYPSDPRPRRAAEVLVRMGMNVDVICLKQDKSEPSSEIYKRVNIRRISLKRRRGGKFSYVFQYSAFLLISFVLLAFRSLARRYHLVHVHNMPDILIFAALAPKVLGAKVILDLHDPMPELMMTIFGLGPESFGVRLLKKFERWSIRFADIVLTPNAAFVRLFTARSCQVEKIHTLINSPDENVFSFRESPPDIPPNRDGSKPFIVMYHGALVERHGLDLAVLSIEVVKRFIPNVQLRIYGQPTRFIDQIMQLVSVRNLQASVQYFGGKSLAEIVKAIDECDVGIIPNRLNVFTEINMPTRIFEYLSRGKPVIAPSTSGIRDYFKENELVFFERGDADELAQKLLYVFSHPHEVNGTVKRGQAIYLANKWSQEQTKLVTLVSELLNGKGMSLPQILDSSVVLHEN